MTKTEEEQCNVCTDFKSITKTFRKKEKSVINNDAELECPPDKGELGRATWTFLHTMAAYYPENPSQNEQDSMMGFIDGLSKFYPCNYCAEHLRDEIKLRNPPKVGSNVQLSEWFCQIHNEVNERQGKPRFDCSKVMMRWRTGRKGCFE